MIPTTLIIYCGRRLEVPIVNGSALHMPHADWDDWKGDTYCGAGDGIGDWLVPEGFPCGTHITPCCFIHDRGRELCKRKEEYAQNDRIFLKNMIEAVFYHHPVGVIGRDEQTDLFWALSFYSAVDSVK